ncbi:luciferin 4-monooxygenase-like [Lucilia cuprina]|uniref:luciferin 4-monooxygenase-like n=1 Tax=Lucilia cuprina TaxID=7375 RepID=UPI001F06EC37|nr:luciferin 4-monooxygenase-like [Lucilia cuprina]
MMRSSTVRLASQLFRAPTATNTSSCSSISLTRSFNSNNKQQNAAVSGETNLNNQGDKFLHYSHEEGYIKTSPFENTIIPNVSLDKYVWRDFKLWENNVATVMVTVKPASIAPNTAPGYSGKLGKQMATTSPCTNLNFDEELKDIIATARDMEARWGHLFDMIIINNDTERAYHQLLAEINSLEREPQWVPASWTITKIFNNVFNSLCLRFPQTKFLQGYGMTEASPVVLMTSADNTRYASTGFPTPHTEAKIVPIDSQDHKGLGPNQTGELCVRGPQVMKGYLNNEEATNETFYPGGWLRTGDVAYYDDEGYFYITDRMKELIKVKGFQVPPAELEAILRDHPKILEAAVFGIPHPINGEAPRALVVLRENMQATEEEIYNFVAEKVAVYKKLEGGIIFVNEVPKNPTGKILRKVLKEKYSS